MISDIILPKRIGSYYLFAEKVVSIDIGKTNIYATVTLLNGNNRTILDLIEQNIEVNNNLEYTERVINALQLLKFRLPKYDYLTGIISSASVVFKDLTIPFLDEAKVKMVVPFEVESLLPFNLDQASVDSIITKEDKVEKLTEVLVSAVRQDYLDQFVDIFEKAELKLDKITVDILELYSLYKITNYKDKGNAAIIDINLNTICLAIVIDDQLKYVRVIPKGLINAFKKISSELNIDANALINQLINFGVNHQNPEYNENYDDRYTKVIKDNILELFEEIKFAIVAYKEKLNVDQKINFVLLAGLASEIKGITNIINSVINMEVEVFDVLSIINKKEILSKVKTVQNSFLKSIAGSLNLSVTQNFNLYKRVQDEKEKQLILKQIIVSAILFFLIISSFSIYSYLRVRKLKITINGLTCQAVSELNKMFKLKKTETDLKKLNQAANLELNRQETAWEQLSIKNRYSFITYLLQLSKCIKPKNIALDITTLDIKNNKILIYGSVPGYEELNKLQNQFNKCLLNSPGSIQKPSFTKEPIIIDVSNLKE